LRALEDFGYEAVDNLPLALLPALMQGWDRRKRLALGVDSRTRGFTSAGLLGARAEFSERSALLFLECADDVLLRRFTETRRRHPLAPDRPLRDGIAAERALMAEVKQSADLVIDTSDMPLPELKRALRLHFSLDEEARMAVTVTSFSYRNGLPRAADLVFDVRFLRNPHYEAALRPRTGEDAEVRAYVAADPAYAPFLAQVDTMIAGLLPRYETEGKSYLTIAFGCTGGRHRSVALACALAERLAARGWDVRLLHRDRGSNE
jgi:UPF0042 nucleotide-binding protein